MSYSPASIQTSGALPNLVAIYYERQSIPNLKAQTPFLSMTKQKPLPLRSGNQIQFFTYALLAANTNQAQKEQLVLLSANLQPRLWPLSASTLTLLIVLT